MVEQGFRVPEVTKIVGISYRQLDYWARTGLVRPSLQDARGSGTQRLYSFACWTPASACSRSARR
jgi:DNA-binding transcriptional MerR regulator